MSTPKLRYYSDPIDEEDHDRIITALKTIHRKYDIPVEIERVEEKFGAIRSFPGPIRNVSLDEVYDRDFANNRELSRHVGDPPSDVYKTNSGYVMIKGVVGVVDGGLVWGTRYTSTENETDPNRYSVDFVEDVVERGVEAIEEKYGEGNKRTERSLVVRFAQSEILSGDSSREVVVGKSLISDEMSRGSRNVMESVATRRVDLVVQTPESDWVIEAKKSWDAGSFDTALGQVQISDSLYRLDNDVAEDDTQMALLFGDLPTLGPKLLTTHLVFVADTLDVKVFIEAEDGFELVTPEANP